MFLLLWYLVSLLSRILCDPTSNLAIHQNDDSLENGFGEIQFASVIFRHGARTPDADSTTYPLDPHRNYTWTVGLGRLTTEGKNQMFNLGRWFRKRYSNLIANTYESEEITVYSTDRDRSIVSALCFLHGLYPGSGATSWQSVENWQPAPVHTIPVKENIYHLASKVCPRIKEVRRAVYDTPQGRELYERYKKTIAYMETNAGYPFSKMNISNIFRHLRQLKTILYIQEGNNLTLPEWTKTVYPQPMASMEVESLMLEVQSPTWKRLSGGPIVEQITNEIKAKANNPKYKNMLRIHSAHEKTIEAICSVFNVSAVQSGTRAHFGTALIIELRKKNNDTKYTVTTALRNYQDGFVSYYQIPGCGGYNCPLEKYLDIVKPFIPHNWKKECGL